MTSTAADPDDRRAKRNVAVLVGAQAILGAQMPIHFTVGGLSGQLLATDKCWATLPISMTVLATMLLAPSMSNFMQNYGRRAGFLVGTAGGVLGSLTCVLGLYYGSFPIFLLGSFLNGIYFVSHGFFRFAAADTASPEFRPKAISYVMAGGLLAALIGPQLVKVTADAFVIPFMGAYLASAVLNIVGALGFIWLDIPKPPKTQKGPEGGRSRLELLQSPRILTAMICAMVSYALMNLVMTSTPLAVVGCGFAMQNAADVVSAHVIAMYAPSFFTGHLIARYGEIRIIGAGLIALAGAAAVALAGVELVNFFGALILLGIGWNFGFIGATALLTKENRPAEQGRIQGMNDFAVFGLVTLASVSSGGLMNCSGGSAVEGWTAVNIAAAPFLMLAAVVARMVSGQGAQAGRLRVAIRLSLHHRHQIRTARVVSDDCRISAQYRRPKTRIKLSRICILLMRGCIWWQTGTNCGN